MDNRLFIFDTTLRDGEQVPGCQLNTVEKIQVAKQLEALGVDVIEAGFPISSPGDFSETTENRKPLDSLLNQGASSKTAATYSPTVTQYHRRDEA